MTVKKLATDIYTRLQKEKCHRSEIVKQMAYANINRVSVGAITGLPLGYIDAYYPTSKRVGVPKATRVKAIAKLVKELDTAFGLYIRARDLKNGCISCFRPMNTLANSGQQVQCGHFIKREYYPLRWDETNCNGQCARCNGPHGLQGNYVGYYKGMVAKYGQETPDSLYLEGKLWNFGTPDGPVPNTRPDDVEWLTDQILHYRHLTR